MLENNSQDFSLITNWAEISERPNFKYIYNFLNEDDARGKLKTILKQYQFKDKVKCSISSCRQSHQKGYLVKIVDETEIIIGNCCGKKYFGVEFTQQSRLMNTKRIEAENYKFLEDLYMRVDKIKQEFESVLCETGRLGFYQINRAIKALADGDTLLHFYMVKDIRENISSIGSIREKVLKTKMQIGIEEEMKRNAGAKGDIEIDAYEYKVVESVDCFDIIYQWYEAAQLKNALENLIAKVKDPKPMLAEDRKKLVKGFRGYESRLMDLKEFCIKGNVLLQPDNLMKVQRIFTREEYKNIWSKWVKSLG